MYHRFTDRASKVMRLASQESQRFNHEYIGTEHILLALVKEGAGVAATVLRKIADLRQFRLAVEKLIQSGPEIVTIGTLPLTAKAKKVIQDATEEARELAHEFIGTEHLLLGLLRSTECIASDVLRQKAVDLDQMRTSIMVSLGNEDYVSEPDGDQTEPRSNLLKKMNNRALHCLSLARNIAVQQNSPNVDTQHLLLGILKQKNNDGAFAFRLSGIGFEEAETKAIELFSIEATSDTGSEQSPHRLGMSDELLLALNQAESLAKKVINADFLTLGLLRPPNDAEIEFNSTKLIKAMNADPKTVVKDLSSCMSPKAVTSQNYANSVSDPREKQGSKLDAILTTFGRNLTLSARFNCNPPIQIDVGVVERMLSIFLRRNRNNLLLVGDNEKCRAYLDSFSITACGVNAPYLFEDTQIVEIAVTDLIHDAKFEKNFVQALNAVRSQTGIILAMPSLLELHKFSSPFRSQYTLLEALHPWLVLPGFRMVGTCHPDELERLNELPHIVSQFEVVRLNSVELPTTAGLILRQVNKLEEHHLCVYSDSAISTAQKLCQSLDAEFRIGQSIVNASIELLDEAGVKSVLNAVVITESLEESVQQKVREFDRELNALNRGKQTSFEEGNFKTMWQFDFRFEEVLRERVAVQPLPEVRETDVIEVFAKQNRINEDEARSRLG